MLDAFLDSLVFKYLFSVLIDVLMHKYFQYARLAAESIHLVYNVIKG